MANILEFLRGVLTDGESQRLFRSDPEGFVTRAGFGDLTGEDVVEAIAVLRRSLLPDVAEALADFEDESRLPAVRPAFSERELDAAVRQLMHAVDLAGSAMGVPREAPAPEVRDEEPEPEPEPEPVRKERFEAEVEPELVEGGPASDPEPSPPDHPATPIHDEPIEVDREPAFSAGVRSSAGVSSGDAGVRADLPSVQALGAAITSASADVRSLLEEYAEEVFERLSTIVEQAERDAAGMRVDAQQDAATMRADAERDAAERRADAAADRESARRELADARDEAERVRRDAVQAQSDIDARRSELRGAERELKDRLAGLDAVFRTVLKDDGGS